MKIPTANNQKDRRKILYWMGGMLSVVMFWKFLPVRKRRRSRLRCSLKMVGWWKWMKHLGGQRTKLKPDEFHSWAKRKK
jgi:hypothetical protein